MRFVLAVLMALVTAIPPAAAAGATADVDGRSSFLPDPDALPTWRHPDVAVTYTVGKKGDVGADLATFRRTAAQVLADDDGWAAGGRVAFVEARRRPDFRLWLAAPDRVAAANSECDADFSCRVGDDIYINARRWRLATDTYRHRSLGQYRRYVINHEVGHWLGLDHAVCPGVGEPAPVMLQQSKHLQGCDAQATPRPPERRESLLNLRG